MLKREEPLSIDGPCGVLEALYFDQPQARGLALICHPNPVKGGTMLNKVVSTLQRTARDAGYSTLRFNYRGVGGSAGAHDMVEGEVDDVEEVGADHGCVHARAAFARDAVEPLRAQGIDRFAE